MISILVLCALAVSVNANALMPARCCSPVAYTAILQENGGTVYMGKPEAVDVGII